MNAIFDQHELWDENEYTHYDGEDLYTARLDKPPVVIPSSSKTPKIISKGKQKLNINNTSKLIEDITDQQLTQQDMINDYIMDNINESENKIKRKRQPPTPIQIKYNIVDDVFNQKANIDVGDLIKSSHTLRRQLLTACRPKRKTTKSKEQTDTTAIDIPLNTITNSELTTTAAYTSLIINDKRIKGLIDSGASKSCMSKSMMKLLGLQIDAPSTNIFILGNGTKQATLGTIHDVQIQVNPDIIIPVNMEVLPKCPAHLVLGNNWLSHAQALLNFRTSTLKVLYKHKSAELPITFLKETDKPLVTIKTINTNYQTENQDNTTRNNNEIDTDSDTDATDSKKIV
ncbi:hypothetical protein G6F27_013099 [Rhizopus arrhizus]|nr:hypothetical protein G6F27_013099 [Rhizopus arrhizus]